MFISKGEKYLSAALACAGLCLLAAGCIPRTERQQRPRPAPAMPQTAESQPGYWRDAYNRNRPEAPAEFVMLPEAPRNNQYGEFDDNLYNGLDTQPDLPPLPADGPSMPAMAPPATVFHAQQYAERPAPAPVARVAPADAEPAGVRADGHFYPIEQLVFGGDYPDIDRPELYRLMPKDVITVAVRDHPEFSGQLEIQPDGTIRVPNAHDLVRLRGLTVEEAAEELRRTLSVYIKGEAVVRVQANRARGGYYFVFGEVTHPGRFPMGLEPVKLSEAVLAASWEINPARRDLDGEELGPAFPAAAPRGRFSALPTADLARVALITPHRSQPVRTVHDVRSALLGVTANDPLIKPGQIIVIPSLVPDRNQSLGAGVPPGLLPGQGFGYNTTPASLPEVTPPRYSGLPGDTAWIESVPRRPEPEVESLIFPEVDNNMAAAYETAMTTSRSELEQGITVEGPNIVHLERGQALGDVYPMVGPDPARRKVVRTNSRSGQSRNVDGWVKGF